MNTIEDKTFINLDTYARKINESKLEKRYENVQSEDQVVGEKVQLSQAANRFLEAKRRIESISDIRNEKVSEIRDKIASGTYQANYKTAASNLLEESLMNEHLL